MLKKEERWLTHGSQGVSALAALLTLPPYFLLLFGVLSPSSKGPPLVGLGAEGRFAVQIERFTTSI